MFQGPDGSSQRCQIFWCYTRQVQSHRATPRISIRMSAESFSNASLAPLAVTTSHRHCGATFQRFRALALLSMSASFGTNRFAPRFESMARASKTRKGVIPEPSFEFFLRAIGVMLLLVVIMTAYFFVRT